MSGQVQVPRYNLVAIESAVANIQQVQAHLSSQVGTVQESQEHMRAQVLDLRSLVEEFIARDRLAKNVQLAETKIVGIRAQIETEFGHYDEVRRLATGLLQAADVGIVTTATMRQLSEELMLLAPKYWLAPAVVGLAAWIRNDRALAERALVEALRRDHDKSTLFFALILRRYQRLSATARWLDQYVSRQDPNQLARDFMVVLDGVSTGTLGSESRPMVMSHVDQWFEEINAKDEIKKAQVQRWEALIGQMRTATGSQYRVLPEVSPTWSILTEIYESATVHGNALEHFNTLFDTPIVDASDQRERVDAILESLVTRFDVEEQPARRKVDELQAIIDSHGDEVAARAVIAGQEQVHDTRVDLLTLLTNAAFFPEQSGASLSTQKFATAKAKPWIKDAIDQLHARNVQSMPSQVELHIEGWHGAISEHATQEGLTDSLTNHIETETVAKINAVKFIGAPLVAAVVGGLAVLIAIVTLISAAVGAGIFFLVIGAVAGAYAYTQYLQLPKRREAIRVAGEQRKALATNKLNGAIAEAVDLRREWEGQIMKATELRTYLEGLSYSAFTSRPADQARVVGV